MTLKSLAAPTRLLALAAVLFLPAGLALADESSEQTTASVSRGAVTWNENCARCHNMRRPDEFRDDQWQVIVNHMRIRAGLTGKETRDIVLFLQQSN